jgi:hypothetical protein
LWREFGAKTFESKESVDFGTIAGTGTLYLQGTKLGPESTQYVVQIGLDRVAVFMGQYENGTLCFTLQEYLLLDPENGTICSEEMRGREEKGQAEKADWMTRMKMIEEKMEQREKQEIL